CWPKAVAAPKRERAATRSAAFRVALNVWIRIACLVVSFGFFNYRDSSITNSRESTNIIISIPPGKTLLVVISRSLCECHMNAKPRSLAGFACMLAGCKGEQFGVGLLPAGAVTPVVPVTQPA